MNKTLTTITILWIFTIGNILANIDIGISSNSRTISINYTSSQDFNLAPQNIWNSQVFTLRWSTDLGQNVFVNLTNTMMFSFQTDGPIVDGGDGFYYQKFTSSATNVVQNFDNGVSTNVFEILVDHPTACEGTFELVTGTLFVSSIFGTASVNNVLGEQFNSFNPSSTIVDFGNCTFDCNELSLNFGDACEDGFAFTVGETVQLDCSCAPNTCIDTDRIVPNTNCPTLFDPVCGCDGNEYSNECFAASEGVTSWTFGPCPKDCPNLNLNIGDNCDDNNPNTENDTVDSNCICTGTAIGPCDNNGGDADNDGVCADVDCDDNNATLGATGSSCDDGDSCTINDVLDANCNCEGIFQDTDNDDVCDANDLCDGSPDPGQTCDDNNPNTENDTVDSNCNCIGTPIGPCDNNLGDADNDGFCADEDCDDNDATIGASGSSCDDGNNCTINDVLDINCNCVGTFQDTDNDGVCDADDVCNNGPDPGQACDDDDPNTENDTVDSSCDCIGTILGPCDNNGGDNDNDGVCADIDCDDNDATIGASGSSCDDGNPASIGEAIQDDCTCKTHPCIDLDLIDDTVLCSPFIEYVCGCDNITYQSSCIAQYVFGVPAWTDGPCNNLCPNLNLTIGSPCDDGNSNTINDLVDANCNCIGTQIGPCDNNGGDTDNDGVCADEDCDDGDSTIGAVGSPCDDGNPNTVGETIQSDCSCGPSLCIDPSRIDPNANCTLEIAPVCGCNGIEYSNACFANISGVTSWTDGTCDTDCDIKVIIKNVIPADCRQNNGQINSVSIVNIGSGIHFEWSNGVSGNVPGDLIVNKNLSPGTYSITITNEFGCTSTDSAIVGEDCDCPDIRMNFDEPCDDNDETTMDDVITFDCICEGTTVNNPCVNNGGDSDGDGICDDFDNCVLTANPSQEDSDCDTVGDACDQCPGGDDSMDTYGDPDIPDCLEYDFDQIPKEWKCGNNNKKVWICHIPQGNQENKRNICVNENVVQSHLDHGDFLGYCNYVSCGNSDNCEVIIEERNGEIFIDGFTKPVIIKVFDQDYRIVFSCIGDECTAPLSIDQLSLGEYYVKINFYDIIFNGSWVEVCEEANEKIVIGNNQFRLSDDQVLDLSANENQKMIHLDWVSNGDYKTKKYILERSRDGLIFNDVFETLSQSKSRTNSLYNHEDILQRSGEYYYRVKQVLDDGEIVVSNTVIINYELDIEIYPNPTYDEFYINLDPLIGQEVSIQVYDVLGILVLEQNIDKVGDKPLKIDLSNQTTGVYAVRIVPKGKRHYTKFVALTR